MYLYAQAKRNTIREKYKYTEVFTSISFIHFCFLHWRWTVSWVCGGGWGFEWEVCQFSCSSQCLTWFSWVDASFTCTICLKYARCSFQKHPQKTTCFGLYIFFFYPQVHLHSSPTGRETGGHGNIDVIGVCEQWTFCTLEDFPVVKIMGGKKTAKYSVLKSTLLTQGIIDIPGSLLVSYVLCSRWCDTSVESVILTL